MRTFKLKKDLVRKGGEVVARAGENVTVSWDTNSPTVAILAGLKVRTTNLPNYINVKPVPSEKRLEKIVCDSICPSVFGKTVEPDGWDSDGSPSWLLALGVC